MSAQANLDRQLRFLLLAVAGMFAFAVFAMPPIYRVFCELTGLNGKPAAQAAEALANTDLGRTVQVEFVTSVEAGLPWDFVGTDPVIRVHPGQIQRINFRVRNRGDQAITGRAIPSVSPAVGASHLKKTQCFCFESQTLAAGESVDMPVIFYVDPDLPRQVGTITLAYRFYRQPDAAPKG